MIFDGFIDFVVVLLIISMVVCGRVLYVGEEVWLWEYYPVGGNIATAFPIRQVPHHVFRHVIGHDNWKASYILQWQ